MKRQRISAKAVGNELLSRQAKQRKPHVIKLSAGEAEVEYHPGQPQLEREARNTLNRFSENLSPEQAEEIAANPIVAKRVAAKLNAQTRADAFTQSEYQAAAVQLEFGQSVLPGMEIDRLRANLEEANARISADDMKDVEAMLFSQAQALNAVFTSLARRAANQDYLPQYQTYLTLALKAQSQSRSTLEALAYVKNPPSATFVRQQNVANNQQVNNHAHSRTEALTSRSNELLEVPHEKTQQLDPRTAAGAISQDSRVASMGTRQRAKKR